MKCTFIKTEPTAYFCDLSLGQAFRYKEGMFLVIDEIYDRETSYVMNAVCLETGELTRFDGGITVLPCRINGFFEPVTTGE